MVGNTVGTRIRQARIARNMTIKALVRASGISEFTIINIEHDRQNPSLSTLEVLSHILNISVTKLGAFDLLPENTFAERITKVRLMLGMTKTQFAQFIGVGESTIRFWERGNQMPHKIQIGELRSKIFELEIRL